MADTSAPPVANPLAVNTAPRMLVRTNLNEFDPLSYLTQVNENNALLNSSLNPQAPERSWTQGLARLLTSALSGYKQAGLNNQLAAYKTGKMSDLQTLGDYLSKGGDFKQVLASMKNPEDQSMALQFAQALAMRGAEFNNQLALKKYQSGLDIDKEQAKAQASPQAQSQAKLSAINEDLAKLQVLASNETDPTRKQALLDQMGNMGKTRDQMMQQIQMDKGAVPDQSVISKNKAFEALSKGIKPSDLPQDQQIALAGNSYLDSIKKINDSADKDIDEMNSGFKAARAIHDQGQTILQQMGSNPSLGGGPGRETLTKFQTMMNGMFPGMFPDVGDQQNFQNQLAQMVVKPIGELHANGVQRITQNEIQHIVKQMIPSVTNSSEGIKDILELQDALYIPQKQAQDALSKINSFAASNPFFNKAAALNDIKDTLSSESEKASMAYMNQKLAAQGKQIILNPQYDPNVGGINKYVTVPLQKSPVPGQNPAASSVTPPSAAPQNPLTQPNPVAPKVVAPPPQTAPAVPAVPMPPPPTNVQPSTPDQIAAGIPIAHPSMPVPLPPSAITPLNPQQHQPNPLLQLAANDQSGAQY